MTTKERLKNDVYWIFSDKGIEQKIYQAVSNKKDYTSRLFKKDYKLWWENPLFIRKKNTNTHIEEYNQYKFWT